MPLVCIGIGSNRGCKTFQIQRALVMLSVYIRNMKKSKIYQTEPYGVTDQPEFLNLVVCGETLIPPLELLTILKKIERKIGRMPSKRWGPREIDLDIIIYGNFKLSTPILKIPHPDMENRPFVTIPLKEVLEG